MSTHRPLSPLSAHDRDKLNGWVSTHLELLPEFVLAALEQHSALVAGLNGTRYRLSRTLLELKRALGLVPSSERKSSGDPVGPLSNGDGQRPKDKRAQLKLRAERLEKLADWHRDLSRRHRRKAKDLQGRLMKAEDVELTEQEKAEVAQEQRQFKDRLALGAGADESLQTSTQALMTGAEVSSSSRTVSVAAEVDESEDTKVLDALIEHRERYDFSFSVCRIDVEVQKKVVDDGRVGRHVVCGSTAALGPARFAVTWEFLAHMALLVVQYAMPMHRLGRLLSTESKRFTSAYLARLLHYVGRRFAPVYLALVDGVADAQVLVGDDTSTRVLEVTRHFKKKTEQEPPWNDFRTPDKAAETLKEAQENPLKAKARLGPMLGTELGFEFDRRRREGTKTSLNTTTVSGRSDQSDPTTLIVLYRSHLGGFGNLLEILLNRRKARLKNVTVQSDLATVNLVVDPVLRERFCIRYAGCASHARRPFSLYEHEDPELCPSMLHFFKGLFIYEQCLDAAGRNRENVLAVRGTDCRQLWADILDVANTMTLRWSAKSKLGEGARYIIRHFDKLTAYLDDPRLELTDNFAERMLRMEKLIENNSLFRSTLEGRFALDVMRTVLQTAVAARAPLQEYLLSVLRTSPEEVDAAPENYTPKAWVDRRTNTLVANEAA